MALIRPIGFDDLDHYFDSWNNRFDRLFRNWETQLGGPLLTQQQLQQHQQHPQQSSAGQASGALVGRSPFAFDWAPVVDVADSEKEVTVHAELPGLKKEEIKVEVLGQQLVISGETQHQSIQESPNKDQPKTQRRWKIRERSFGKFERRILLPKEADLNSVSANYKDGVLEVHVAKRPDSAPRKAITVQ